MPLRRAFDDLQRQQKEDGNGREKGDEEKTAEGGDVGTQNKVLRTYGQKKAKVDPVSEQAAMMDPEVLALIAGKKRG